MKELDLPNRIFQQNKQLDVHYSEHRRQSPYDKKSLANTTIHSKFVGFNESF